MFSPEALRFVKRWKWNHFHCIRAYLEPLSVVHTVSSCVSKIHFNIIISFTRVSHISPWHFSNNILYGYLTPANVLHITLFNYIYFNSFIYQWLTQPFVGPWPLLQFCNLFYTDGGTPWKTDQAVARPLPTHKTRQTQNKLTHKHPYLWAGSEPTISAFEQAKTFHALDRAATVIGYIYFNKSDIKWRSRL
jgi:hypothetical protein